VGHVCYKRAGGAAPARRGALPVLPSLAQRRAAAEAAVLCAAAQERVRVAQCAANR